MVLLLSMLIDSTERRAQQSRGSTVTAGATIGVENLLTERQRQAHINNFGVVGHQIFYRLGWKLLAKCH